MTSYIKALDTAVQNDLIEADTSPLTISLQDFVTEFGDELLDSDRKSVV